MKNLMAEVYGKVTGCGHGRLGSLHLSDPEKGVMGALAIVGGGSPVSVGVAFAQQRLTTGGVTVVFFGDGASDRGTQHEAMNIASLWKLPIVFVVENNGFAYFTSQEKHQVVRDISMRASAYCMPGATVDGNDAAAVYDAACSAVDYCREGNGPVLLECKTYRVDGHFVGDDCPYRDPGVTQMWIETRDPIANLGGQLLRQGFAASDLKAMQDSARLEAAEAAAFARSSADPAPDSLPDITYAEGGAIHG
jgi:pyruvate dehydrogenase E1 component alpha subunit